MGDVLIFGDTERSPELRHEIPVGIGDPFLYVEKGDERHVVVGSLEVPRLEGLGLQIHPLVAFGIEEVRRQLAGQPLWTETMVAGRGWIALALVVFSTWKPVMLGLGAFLFGFVTIAGFQAEAWGIPLAPNLLATLPYLATILVLVLISRDTLRLKLNAPAALGKPFHPAG